MYRIGTAIFSTGMHFGACGMVVVALCRWMESLCLEEVERGGAFAWLEEMKVGGNRSLQVSLYKIGEHYSRELTSTSTNNRTMMYVD